MDATIKSVELKTLQEARDEIIGRIIVACADKPVEKGLVSSWAREYLNKRFEEAEVKIDENKIRAIAVAILNSIVEEGIVEKTDNDVRLDFKGWVKYFEEFYTPE
jgi:hypothetical protein